MKMMKCDPRAFARCPYSKECSDSPEHTSFYKGTDFRKVCCLLQSFSGY